MRHLGDASVAVANESRNMTSRRDHKLWNIGQTTRKTTLVVHIVSAGAWIGIDVIVGVLVVVGWFSADSGIQGVAYVALGRFAVAPMLTSGLVCLGSGIVLGLGTRYGLLRYWWVAVKLGMNVILCVLIVLALRPGMPDIVEHGQRLIAGAGSPLDVSRLFFPPVVSLTALTTATIIAVFEPWGRLKAADRVRDGQRAGVS